MKRLVIVLICCVFMALVSHSSAQEAEQEKLAFKIIIHASNPNTTLNVKDISRLFLKKIKVWEQTDEKVFPVDLVEDSPIREAFSKIVHKKAVSSVKAYWQKQVFSGRGVPPEEKKTDEEVLQYVAEHVGAIGYISAETEPGDYEVQILEIIQ